MGIQTDILCSTYSSSRSKRLARFARFEELFVARVGAGSIFLYYQTSSSSFARHYRGIPLRV